MLIAILVTFVLTLLFSTPIKKYLQLLGTKISNRWKDKILKW